MAKRLKSAFIGASLFVFVSCSDEIVTPVPTIPPRGAFDDGRELFFNKPNRGVGSLDWAPDGRRFVYADTGGSNDYKVNIYNTVTGEDRPIANDSYAPRWSPTGEYILFAELGNCYSIIRPDGTGRRRIINGTPFRNDFDATWMADGREIVWDYIDFGTRSRNIYKININSGNETQVTYDDGADEEYPFCGPGGDWIFFYKRDKIEHPDPSWRTPVNIIRPDGNNYRWLYRANYADDGVCRWLCDISPNGRYVLMNVYTWDGRGEWSDLWSFDLKNHTFKQVTSCPKTIYDLSDSFGVFGPDGMVYFVVFDPGDVCNGIWRVDPHLP